MLWAHTIARIKSYSLVISGYGQDKILQCCELSFATGSVKLPRITRMLWNVAHYIDVASQIMCSDLRTEMTGWSEWRTCSTEWHDFLTWFGVSLRHVNMWSTYDLWNGLWLHKMNWSLNLEHKLLKISKKKKIFIWEELIKSDKETLPWGFVVSEDFDLVEEGQV